jgi:hypothetical protein
MAPILAPLRRQEAKAQPQGKTDGLGDGLEVLSTGQAENSHKS